ncbi:GAF domain-containing sensor histidine kinase [Anaerolineales bacterium HSG25]|nr:GAF domain-containing sensor histidine kinase [Anaerolineales bacterium HSG25]
MNQPSEKKSLTNLLRTLSDLHEQIHQAGANSTLRNLLQLIIDQATRSLNGSPSFVVRHPLSFRFSAVIWLCDESSQLIDSPTHRIPAKNSSEQLPNDFPRSNGLGRQAMYRRQPIYTNEETNLVIHPAWQQLGFTVAICYPLIRADLPVGLFYVYHAGVNQLNEGERLFLQNCAHLATTAIYNRHQPKSKNNTLARRVDELEKLWLAIGRINSRSTLASTLREILSSSLDMLGAQYGSVEIYDKKCNLLRLGALAGYKRAPDEVLDMNLNDQSVIGWVATHIQPMLITDLRTSRWRSIYRPLPVNREMRSEVAVPLIGTGGGLEGVINIESPLPNAFQVKDKRLLQTIASHAVIAMQEIRLLDALHEIFNRLLISEPTALFKLIIDWACDLINVPVGSVWLIGDAGRLVVEQSTAGYKIGDSIALSESLTQQALQSQQIITIDDLRLSPVYQKRPMLTEHNLVSMIVVPLLLPKELGHTLGSFSFFSTHLRDFSSWDKRILLCLANHAAIAIQYAKQFEQLQEAQERQALAETFAALGDVSANLLHQLNNKVGAIPARIQAIEDKSGPALTKYPYLAKNLRRIEESAHQALAIVRDSMAHLRPIEPRPIQLAHCLEQALKRANPRPSILINRHGLTELPAIIAGEQQLEMIFYNLIDNALKAMGNEGVLTLTGHEDDGQVCITVTDNGPGIAPHIRPFIFELMPLHQHGQSNRLGFGLWWVKRFVDRFGGHIEMESETGQGTTFTVFLPIES